MRRNLLGTVAVLFLFGIAVPRLSADTYTIDNVHSSVTFRIRHLDISWVYGRFNEISGTFTLDKDDPAKSSLNVTIKADSVDSNNPKRDGHLRSPDFFNTKQFPEITFRSSSVKAADGGYEVTGELTMHGVTKPVTLALKGGDKVAEFPKGFQRVGLSGELILKRSDFGMDKMTGLLGDEVQIGVGVEGTEKK
jgi:polyisoprenoid-binding protein YceI